MDFADAQHTSDQDAGARRGALARRLLGAIRARR